MCGGGMIQWAKPQMTGCPDRSWITTSHHELQFQWVWGSKVGAKLENKPLWYETICLRHQGRERVLATVTKKSKKGWADNSLKWRASTEDKSWKSNCNSQLVEDTPNPCNRKDDGQQLLEEAVSQTKRELSINWGKVLNSSVTTEWRLRGATSHLLDHRAKGFYILQVGAKPLKTTSKNNLELSSIPKKAISFWHMAF